MLLMIFSDESVHMGRSVICWSKHRHQKVGFNQVVAYTGPLVQCTAVYLSLIAIEICVLPRGSHLSLYRSHFHSSVVTWYFKWRQCVYMLWVAVLNITLTMHAILFWGTDDIENSRAMFKPSELHNKYVEYLLRNSWSAVMYFSHSYIPYSK